MLEGPLAFDNMIFEGGNGTGMCTLLLTKVLVECVDRIMATNSGGVSPNIGVVMSLSTTS